MPKPFRTAPNPFNEWLKLAVMAWYNDNR